MPLWVVRTLRAMRTRRLFSVLLVSGLLAVSLLGNACTFYYFGKPDDITFGDALWYSVISITTIGYGDYSAVTPGARWGTVVFIVIFGLGTFSAVFGFGVDWVNELIEMGRTGMGEVLKSSGTKLFALRVR